MKNNTFFYIISLIFLQAMGQAQAPKTWSSTDIYMALEKLNFLGSVLYVAAHPDDENTRMISYLSNEVKARTAYLSLTRGDGGQNLIGPEIRELLGVIRTQELLSARRIDGGEQLFSRANDFGFSKHSDETLEIWDKDKVLSDVVWAIRKFRPDIIINRFDHNSAGRTHGHHTASAVLSYEAFDLSGDSVIYPNQLNYVEAYEARRLFFNTSWWFYGSRENFAKADKSDMIKVDIGTFYPLLGKSNSEIAAESRSQHKCQGMGNTGSRGSQEEYLQLLKGDMPPSDRDLFAGINTTWSRIPGGESLGNLVAQIMKNFDFSNPAMIVDDLVLVRNRLINLADHPWKSIKLTEIDNIIAACMGLYLEVVTDEHRSCAGQEVGFRFEVTNRAEVPLILKHVSIDKANYDSIFQKEILYNEAITWSESLRLDNDLPFTPPYWLMEKGTLGMYNVEQQDKIGNPETDPALMADIVVSIFGEDIMYSLPIKYKYNSPEDGPVYRPFEIIQEAFVSIPDKVQIFQVGESKKIQVAVEAGKDNLSGSVSIGLPENWTISPSKQDFIIDSKGESKLFAFEVFPPVSQDEVIARPKVVLDEKSYHHEMVEIDYPHIPFQSVLIPAEAKFVNLDIDIAGRRVGYIVGAGDDIPSSLSQVGYQVDILNPDEITADQLANYDAVIMGVRAYNKWESLKFKQKELLTYVKYGGTMIVQYNTSHRLKTNNLGPYPLTLSRVRVSKEDAPVTILAPDHPVMNYPNKITEADFSGWVQERGLYFPNEWDDKYTPILSSHDPGEEPANGGLLIASYGEGWYVYSGYSWFRELPAGVPGAFRIFANIIALGNTVKP